MSGNWKHTLLRTTMGLLLAGVLTGAFLLGSNERANTRCTGINVTIKDSLYTRFITEKAVEEYLALHYKGLVGMPLDSIDLYRIEETLNSNSAILKSEAYITGKGTLNITLIQRKPAVELVTKDESFYSTADGYLLPLQPHFTQELLVIDGVVPINGVDWKNGRPEEQKDIEWLESMLQVVNFINASDIWKGRIAKITCGSSGELTIIPKAGSERFLFGHPKDIEEKFEKIRIYYERITADKGKDRYITVDLRFRGQIVCKETETEKKK